MTTFASPTFSGDFQSLCNTVADVLNRQDLVSAIPNFVALATQRISRDMTRLNHPSSIKRTTLFAHSDYVDLPTDFLTVYQLLLADTSRVLSYLAPDEQMQVMASGWSAPDNTSPPIAPYQGQTTGPTYFTIIGAQIRLFPAQTISNPLKMDLIYYRSMPPLNATSTTNWALTKYPDLYLYGTLAHSAPYLKADERLAVWEGAYQKILSDIELEASRATRPQSKLNAARKSF
jgi:hypothetical protein